MPELGPYGSVRGARGNSRPYRDSNRLTVKTSLLTHTGSRPLGNGMSSHSGHRPFPVSDVHSVSWLFGKRRRDHSQPVAFLRPPCGVPLLKPRSLLRRYPWKMWYSCKAGSAFDLRLAAKM